MLTRLRTRLTLDAALDTLTTMVLPIVDYGQLIYGSGNKQGLDKIQSCIDRMTKVCYYLDKDTDIETLRAMAGITSLEERRDKALSIAAFHYIQDPTTHDTRAIQTRRHDATLAKVNWYKLTTAQHSVTYRIAHKWNSLTNSQRNSSSLNVFLKAIK